MKYKKYVKLCEMIGITPLSYSAWLHANEKDESIYDYLIDNIDKISIKNK
tara:strand:+ start:139 stop:288 length:150 start_codon:yes stop_codon:yes gene_type:complete